MKYAVMIEIDEGEWDYVRQANPFNYTTPVAVYDTEEEAQEAASIWITGRVVEWPEIREMTPEERRRAIEKMDGMKNEQ